MAPAVIDFVDLLTRTDLLSPVQADELSALFPRFDNLTEFTKELVNRGWLTSYQVKQIDAGHYSELLMGPYILLEELGQGGMGRVFKARHKRLDRIVALKVINPTDLTHPEAIRRFHREARAIARLRRAAACVN